MDEQSRPELLVCAGKEVPAHEDLFGQAQDEPYIRTDGGS